MHDLGTNFYFRLYESSDHYNVDLNGDKCNLYTWSRDSELRRRGNIGLVYNYTTENDNVIYSDYSCLYTDNDVLFFDSSNKTLKRSLDNDYGLYEPNALLNHNWEIRYTSKSEGVFLDRSCTIYHCEYFYDDGHDKLKENTYYWVDDECDFILKYEYSYDASSVDGWQKHDGSYYEARSLMIDTSYIDDKMDIIESNITNNYVVPSNYLEPFKIDILKEYDLIYFYRVCLVEREKYPYYFDLYTRHDHHDAKEELNELLSELNKSKKFFGDISCSNKEFKNYTNARVEDNNGFHQELGCSAYMQANGETYLFKFIFNFYDYQESLLTVKITKC